MKQAAKGSVFVDSRDPGNLKNTWSFEAVAVFSAEKNRSSSGPSVCFIFTTLSGSEARTPV